jgi:CheY-like chemotaxis protein
MFAIRHHNRKHMPNKYLLICEDDLTHQKEFLELSHQFIEPQGFVDVILTPSAVLAASSIQLFKDETKLIILDHDMPIGNGSDFIMWLNHEKIRNIPIITASGHLPNNPLMFKLCKSFGIPCIESTKRDVLDGKVNDIINSILYGSDKKSYK